MEIPVMIPKPIKDLKGEELKALIELKDTKVYDVVRRLIDGEIKNIKELTISAEPEQSTPVHIDYYQNGKRKGRIIGALLFSSFVKFAEIELQIRAQKLKADIKD